MEAVDTEVIRALPCGDPEKTVTEYFQAIYDDNATKLALFALSEQPEVIKPEMPDTNQPKVIAKGKDSATRSPEQIGKTWITKLFPEFIRKRDFTRNDLLGTQKEGAGVVVTAAIEKESGLSLKAIFTLGLQEKCWRIRDISLSSD